MEDHWAYFYQDEGIEELRHCLLYITELEATILSAKEEITRREFEIDNLKELLTKTAKERNEAQLECQKLMQEKLEAQLPLLKNQQKEPPLLQKNQEKQLQEEMQFLKQEAPPISVTYSNEDSDSTNYTTVSEPMIESPLPEVILKLAAERPLPQKGKLLQAVKDAGPLLQTLLLAGPLPQWQHPPPQLDSIEIPPVTISSPTARLVHQDSFNSFNACFSKKRGLEIFESLNSSSSSPNSKHQKIAFH
ncbi:hypothetical protein JCGZ_16176 [Jatropha curcas]|uniref:Uncharacterized protein n=1 Tax=Jatropha curcas TaxID=180498 RepID=A0A067K2Y8_JATCU|nr:uncharacterized protein LOC105641137 [Jatropha curcas]KDP30497.1 hypothetical protein JCGZ_16176 [Jatropha curcas]